MFKCSKTLVLNTFIEMVSLFISSDLNKQEKETGKGACCFFLLVQGGARSTFICSKGPAVWG